MTEQKHVVMRIWTQQWEHWVGTVLRFFYACCLQPINHLYTSLLLCGFNIYFGIYCFDSHAIVIT